ncbi:MAG: YiiX/YebB-like N1pC/P60 family cysteine hydrolase [Sphingomonadaceae bacterium]
MTDDQFQYKRITQRDAPSASSLRTGDFLWPKSPHQYVPYRGGAAADPIIDALRWEEGRVRYLSQETSDDELRTLSFADFHARYVGDPDVSPKGDRLNVANPTTELYVGHVALVLVEDGSPHVIEALYEQGVTIRPYEQWLTERPTAVVWHARLRNAEEKDCLALARAATAQLGKPFHFFNFDLLDDRGFYCSKLCWYAVWVAVGRSLDGNNESKRNFWFSPKQMMRSNELTILHSPAEYSLTDQESAFHVDHVDLDMHPTGVDPTTVAQIVASVIGTISDSNFRQNYEHSAKIQNDKLMAIERKLDEILDRLRELPEILEQMLNKSFREELTNCIQARRKDLADLEAGIRDHRKVSRGKRKDFLTIANAVKLIAYQLMSHGPAGYIGIAHAACIILRCFLVGRPNQDTIKSVAGHFVDYFDDSAKSLESRATRDTQEADTVEIQARAFGSPIMLGEGLDFNRSAYYYAYLRPSGGPPWLYEQSLFKIDSVPPSGVHRYPAFYTSPNCGEEQAKRHLKDVIVHINTLLASAHQLRRRAEIAEEERREITIIGNAIRKWLSETAQTLDADLPA